MIKQECRRIDQRPCQILRSREPPVDKLPLAEVGVAAELDQLRIEHDGLLRVNEFAFKFRESGIGRQRHPRSGERLVRLLVIGGSEEELALNQGLLFLVRFAASVRTACASGCDAPKRNGFADMVA